MGKVLANKLLCKRSFENVEPRILTVTELTKAAAIREYKPAAVRAPSNCVSSETRFCAGLKFHFTILSAFAVLAMASDEARAGRFSQRGLNHKAMTDFWLQRVR
jgi:hypothetical protein